MVAEVVVVEPAGGHHEAEGVSMTEDEEVSEEVPGVAVSGVGEGQEGVGTRISQGPVAFVRMGYSLARLALQRICLFQRMQYPKAMC